MRTNYVLIDFESVQPTSLAVLEHDHFKLIVFVGSSQAKVPFETAAALQRMGSRAEYVRIDGNGPNALDFHIAFYIGQIAAAEPGAFFHIISKDKGFDPLIKHLKSRKIYSRRAEDIADIPAVKASNVKSPGERAVLVIKKLEQMKATKPRTVKTLGTTIASVFQNQLSSAEIEAAIEDLCKRGLVLVTGTRVSYELPHEV